MRDLSSSLNQEKKMYNNKLKLKRNNNVLLTAISSMVLLCSTTFASDLTLSNTYATQQSKVSTTVNIDTSPIENFKADDHNRLNDLEALVSQLVLTLIGVKSDLANANSTINTLQTNLIATQDSLAVVKSNSVLELDGLLRYAVIDGHDTAEFTAINVQVNDGTGSTSGPVNGLGNLTIGYNETTYGAPEFCSSPQHDNQIDCEGASATNIWDNNVRRGSHNLIIGRYNSYDDYGSFIAGEENIVNAPFASISGGKSNIANAYNSRVSGGIRNKATAIYSNVSGGNDNTASGNFSTVNGGYDNTASGGSSTVSGGGNNTASANYSSVSGGRNNTASSFYTSVSGGLNRISDGFYDWVAGSLVEDQ
ncbi:MAG: hypothetical protein JKY19_03985 [Alcanivoracaceae bacterium]|nr:hypothetical protein [Alcanivoracaceae bacterium]